jgi:cytochrome c
MQYNVARKVFRLNRITRISMLASWAACLLFASNAQANAQLALDKGCYSCHGNPPKKNAPSFEQLAANYAKYQGQSDAAAKLASQLHKDYVFGGINAHERLAQESALTLVR